MVVIILQNSGHMGSEDGVQGRRRRESVVGAVFMNGGAGPWTAVGWWHGGTGGHGVGGGDFDQGAQRHHQHNTFSDSNKSRRTLLEIRIPK